MAKKRFYKENLDKYYFNKELNKATLRRNTGLNYVAIRKEIAKPKSKAIWNLLRDENYRRKVSPRIFKIYFEDRIDSYYNPIFNFKIISPDGDIKSNLHFYEYLELVFTYGKVQEEILDVEKYLMIGNIDDLPFLNNIISQITSLNVEKQSQDYIKKLALDILYDLIYIIKAEVKNKEEIQKVTWEIVKYTKDIKVIWSLNDIQRIRDNSGKISELESATHDNIFGFIYNELYNISHTWRQEGDKGFMEFNKYKLIRFKTGANWGYIKPQRVRDIMVLCFINCNEVIKNKIIELSNYHDEKYNIWENYKLFLSKYYNELFEHFENDTLKLVKGYKENILLKKKEVNYSNVELMPYYEVFKSVIYEYFFDVLLVLDDETNEIVKNTYVRLYNGKVKDEIIKRYHFFRIICDFGKYENKDNLSYKEVLADIIKDVKKESNYKDSLRQLLKFKNTSNTDNKLSDDKPKRQKQLDRHKIQTKQLIEKNRLDYQQSLKNLNKEFIKTIDKEESKETISKQFDDVFGEVDTNNSIYNTKSFLDLFKQLKESLFNSNVLDEYIILEIRNEISNISKKYNLDSKFYSNRNFEEYENLNEEQIKYILDELTYNSDLSMEQDIEYLTSKLEDV